MKTENDWGQTFSKMDKSVSGWHFIKVGNRQRPCTLCLFWDARSQSFYCEDKTWATEAFVSKKDTYIGSAKTEEDMKAAIEALELENMTSFMSYEYENAMLKRKLRWSFKLAGVIAISAALASFTVGLAINLGENK